MQQTTDEKTRANGPMKQRNSCRQKDAAEGRDVYRDARQKDDSLRKKHDSSNQKKSWNSAQPGAL